MAKPRSQFRRLGEHVARDTAGDVRARAAAGDPNAIEELRRLEAGLTLTGLQGKVDDILSQMIVRVAKGLHDCGHAIPPIEPEASLSSMAEHGMALLSWANQHPADLDSFEGRMIEVLRLCAFALIESDPDDPRLLLGLVLGYGIGQKYFLALREYSDGPALAREKAMAEARVRGGLERRTGLKTQARDRAICERFSQRQNKHQSAKAWAEDNADRENMSVRNLRRILAKC